jgi:hypothetical protein
VLEVASGGTPRCPHLESCAGSLSKRGRGGPAGAPRCRRRATGKDAGWEATLALLAEYVEGKLQGPAVDDLVPAVAAHLRDCPACAEDYECLLVLARDQSDE